MSKQTAVEWLFNQIPFEWSSSKAALESLQIAKQMEKEQILEFTRNAVRKILDEDRQNPFNLEQYYKEYYEK